MWFNDLRKPGWLNLNCLLGEPIEQFASGSGFSAIEAEGELVEICVKVGVGNGSLVSSQEPAFKKRDYPMHTGKQMDLSRFTSLDKTLMQIPFKSAVSMETVADYRAARLNALGNKSVKSRACRV